jgi:hypothetical protein
MGEKLLQQPLFDPTFINLDYYFNKVLDFFHYLRDLHAGSTVYLFSYIISLFGITIIIYSIVRIVEIQKDEHGHLKHDIAVAMANQYEEGNKGRNNEWETIQDLVNSDNESDWRRAIIEADTLLEQALERRDYPGNGIAEKLKNISPGDLATMQSAWDAHLVRNQIAHDGMSFFLSAIVARRTIQQYEAVLRELGFL